MSSNKTKKGAISGNNIREKNDTMAKSQKSRKRSRESEQEYSGGEQDESLKRQKRPPSRKTAASKVLDAKGSREQVALASMRFKEMVAKCQQQMDDASSNLLKTLSSFPTEDAEIAVLQGQSGRSDKNRPVIHKSGTRCLDHAYALLKAYEEHNAHVLDKRVNAAPHLWEDHITFVSKSLESGLSYGIDLVNALLRPSKEPRLPMLDEAQAQETDKLGV